MQASKISAKYGFQILQAYKISQKVNKIFWGTFSDQFLDRRKRLMTRLFSSRISKTGLLRGPLFLKPNHRKDWVLWFQTVDLSSDIKGLGRN